MNYLKYTQYVYLIAAIVFLSSGIYTLYVGEDGYEFSLIFGVIALFMFFFRRKFAKRFDQYDRENNTKT
ncbi:MAG TPA: hypothetical protein VFQ50_03340 [Flavobacterium sp.]|jgi:hypothetical protein|nr:hypothetical protein [Flavobacterium sp.]